MKKMELEVKILDIDKKKLISQLEKLGAKKIGVINERMYVYDIWGINSRFDDILRHINLYRPKEDSEFEKNRKIEYAEKDAIKYETALQRLRLLFEELNYILEDSDRIFLKKNFKESNLNDLMKSKYLIEIINDDQFIKFIDKFFLSPYKWMRLRQVNDHAEITVKHVLPSKEKLWNVEETEIVVPSIEEGNELLEALGFYHKNYFEKERIKYEFMEHEIDIDSWPVIPTYFEIEGEREEDLTKVLNALGYNFDDAVFCTAKEIFKIYGKSMFDYKEMKFD